MNNFWADLPRPFFILAPMEDVTDVAFRTLIAQKSDPSMPRVMYTEFTSADGLMRADEKGLRKLKKKLEFDEMERPVVAQLFTASAEFMESGARLCAELGFDGLDINMGCPAKEVERQGCGAALIKNPELASELIRAAKRGFSTSQTCVHKSDLSAGPVSIKTRIGYNEDELETWLPALLREEPALITIHARTRQEMSDVPARWEHIAHAVEIRDSLKSKTLIAGNGDVLDIADARAKASETGCDGVMLGRAVFGNPWLFTENGATRSPEEKIEMLIEHTRLFEEKMTGFVSEALMKRHFKAYMGGWDGAKELRVRLMEASDLSAARDILERELLHIGE